VSVVLLRVVLMWSGESIQERFVFILSLRNGGRAPPFYIPELPEISPHPFTLPFHAISLLFFCFKASSLETPRCDFLEFSLSLIEQQEELFG